MTYNSKKTRGQTEKTTMSAFESEKLILLRGVLRDDAVRHFVNAVEKDDIGEYAQAYELLLQENMQNRFGEYLTHILLRDDNLFARRAFAGETDKDVRAAFLHDLHIFAELAAKADDLPERLAQEIGKGFPKIRRGKAGILQTRSGNGTAARLAEYYRKNGYGIFIGNKAFTYENGALQPVKNTPEVSLRDLKDYEDEKRAIGRNIVSFLDGLPYSNMLLYGDKGTGKSSTIHAMLNEYADRGLRAVELPKEQVKEINAVKAVLSALPFHFLIFIDDLSLEENDEKVTALKAGLEGSMNEKSRNVMIVATSNRRHILKENFSDRDNSVHARDTMEEQLSLSDRFGLTVCFSSTGKKEYLSIVRQLADDAGITIPEEELAVLAERWAISKGGRSPRRAKQFVDYVRACTAKGLEIEI